MKVRELVTWIWVGGGAGHSRLHTTDNRKRKLFIEENRKSRICKEEERDSHLRQVGS